MHSDPQSITPPKRRACDECRTRKLACSKESNGCSRCVRERIRCNYSEQKPMGRPRKRQCNGEAKADREAVVTDFQAPGYFDDSFLDDSFLDQYSLRLLDNSAGHSITLPEQVSATGLCTVDDGRAVFHFGIDEFNIPIDFGMEDVAADELSTPVAPAQEEKPCKGFSAFEGEDPFPSSPGPPCGCLTTMYLALSSLQVFPSEVEPALATVRAASNAAQTSIRCTKCGKCSPNVTKTPIEAFQNTMLLATILPIIANGYKRLLVMVDRETNIAKEAGIRKTFRLLAYGGICNLDRLCPGVRHLEEAVMEPDEWRTAVRGLLRADVYGLEETGPGLKGIIFEMEQRQRTRHKELDLLRESELFSRVNHHQGTDEKDMLCMRLLDNAKVAVDSLVIA